MKIKTYLLGLLAVAVLALSCDAQSRTNRLYRPCPGSSTPATVEVQRDGDIDLVPCSGRNVLLNGSSLGGALTGTQNRFPYFSATNTLSNSPYTWNGGLYEWNNTALNSDFTMSLSPALGEGYFQVGSTASRIELQSVDGGNMSLGAGESVSIASPNVFINDFSGFGIQIAGDSMRLGIGGIGQLSFNIEESTDYAYFLDTTGTSNFGLQAFDLFEFNKTITPIGTTGSQTIEKPAGTANIAAGTASLTVTNSSVTANSVILATPGTNDATCSVKNIVSGAGSFVVNMNANCTAATRVGFFILN